MYAGGALGMLVPFLFMLAWLGAAIYMIGLATRLVQAVEQIASSLRQQQLL